jgi:hypothetical protein
MSSTSFPTDLDVAKLHMLEARRALDEFEATHVYGGSPEHQRLEKEFSKAAEAYLRLLEEARKKIQQLGNITPAVQRNIHQLRRFVNSSAIAASVLWGTGSLLLFTADSTWNFNIDY